jgi:hypothetical protein
MKNLILGVALVASAFACTSPEKTNATGDAATPNAGCCAGEKKECSGEMKECAGEKKECAGEQKTCPATGKTIN